MWLSTEEKEKKKSKEDVIKQQRYWKRDRTMMPVCQKTMWYNTKASYS